MLGQLESTSRIEIVKDFHNEYGEQFVIYHTKGKESYYITGDEFDWEGGFQLKGVLLPNSFDMIAVATKKEGMNTFNFSDEELEVIVPFIRETIVRS